MFVPVNRGMLAAIHGPTPVAVPVAPAVVDHTICVMPAPPAALPARVITGFADVETAVAGEVIETEIGALPVTAVVA